MHLTVEAADPQVIAVDGMHVCGLEGGSGCGPSVSTTTAPFPAEAGSGAVAVASAGERVQLLALNVVDSTR